MPYKATTSPFLLGLSCDVIIQAEELYYPFSKRMDEDVSSLGGKDPGASQKPQSGQSPGDPEVTEEQGFLLGLPHRTPWQEFPATPAASTLT